MLRLVALAALLYAPPPVVYYWPGEVSQGVGAFRIELTEGWSPKMIGRRMGRNLMEIREPKFLGPKGATMTVLYQKSVDPELIRSMVDSMDRAQAKNAETYRPWISQDWKGGMYVAISKDKSFPKAHVTAQATDGVGLVTISVGLAKSPSTADFDRLEAMIRSIRLGPPPATVAD